MGFPWIMPIIVPTVIKTWPIGNFNPILQPRRRNLVDLTKQCSLSLSLEQPWASWAFSLFILAPSIFTHQFPPLLLSLLHDLHCGFASITHIHCWSAIFDLFEFWLLTVEQDILRLVHKLEAEICGWKDLFEVSPSNFNSSSNVYVNYDSYCSI